jgi:hypothetical protein
MSIPGAPVVKEEQWLAVEVIGIDATGASA